MGHHARRESLSGPYPTIARGLDHYELENDLSWPFGKLNSIDRDDIRETAYEIFFTACRSSPGFGGRTALTFYSSSNKNNNNNSMNNHDNGGDGSGGSPRTNGLMITPTSRVKRALGLKMLKRSTSRRMVSSGTPNPSSPNAHGGSHITPFSTLPLPTRPRRPMTSAEIMRQQMRVTEQSDNRLRKTLMRTLVGQLGRRAETIILPLELLRHLKPSEFNDTHEYHLWQKRQLRILEVGLLLHPSIPIDKSNTFAMRLRELIRCCETKPIDTGKNSDTMRILCNSVVSLSWRSQNVPTAASDICHWADGYPINIHLYVSLLQSIFDIRDETLVLDEVDELLELMKKTWSTLGITRPIHNVCFTWVLFSQYVATAMIEPDLLCAAHAMLAEVAKDAKKHDNKEVLYYKILSTVLNSMLVWVEKRILNYHQYFLRRTISQIENFLPLAISASKILGEDVTITEGIRLERGDTITRVVDSSVDRVDYYIRTSIKDAFAKVVESDNFKELNEDITEALLQLAKETEDLAMKEREIYSPILKRWHTTAAGVAAVTLHNCYGTVLRQYLCGVETLASETVGVLQRAGKLEKVLVQVVVEDSVDCEDGGKSIVREMIPYEVDSVILNLLKKWIDERLKKGKEIVSRAKETETWNPKSKLEPYAQSAVELMQQAKEAVDDFFQIPIGITEDLVQDLADGLEMLFEDYITFVSSAGSKHSYIPTLPPLTRCNRDSRLVKLWRKASHCGVSIEELHESGLNGHHPRPSTSRGTQRLYIRLNTLHYILSNLQSIDKTLCLSPRNVPSPRKCFNNNNHKSHNTCSVYFELVNSCIQAACQHVSEVAAYRLIFLDSNSVFYDSLYSGDVTNARIWPALRTLKQNLTLLSAILTDNRAHFLVIKQVMKASFEAFLMVLLAGGSYRVFYRADHEMIEEDFESLKKVFCTCGEGLISEEVVDREAEIVEGVVSLMGQVTEQLMEDFSIVTCESSGIGLLGSGQKLPMPPTTGRWNRSDPNTILRVLCHRNDRAANQFLKRSFQLAKRR